MIFNFYETFLSSKKQTSGLSVILQEKIFLLRNRWPKRHIITNVIIVFFIFLAACNKDDGNNASFEIKGHPTVLEVPREGLTESYNVQSDGNWEIRLLEDADWVNVDPVKGSGNGSFTIEVDNNKTSTERELTLAFRVNGRFQDYLLNIKQDSMVVEEGQEIQPFVRIDIDSNELKVPQQRFEERFILRAKGEWKIEWDEEEADWLVIDPVEGVGDASFNISMEENSGFEDREVDLQFYLNGVLNNYAFQIIQEGQPQNEIVILEENFDWLAYGSAVFYTTSGEKRFDSWTQEDYDEGWTSSLNPVTNDPPLYARDGFVKLGRTNYGADLISPKLTEISGTADLIVEFKAVPYQTKAGTRDDNILKVGVVGPGEVSEEEFVIDNWPNYTEDPDCILIWKEPETKRSFRVTGATSDTR